MAYDKRIIDLAETVSIAAAKNSGAAPQLLLAPIVFALADAVEDGRIILGRNDEQGAMPDCADDMRTPPMPPHLKGGAVPHRLAPCPRCGRRVCRNAFWEASRGVEAQAAVEARRSNRKEAA